jgi:hypothetical protein
MRARSRSELSPQLSEGIVCAEWVRRDEIEEKISASFPTIKSVFAAFLE